MGIDGVCAAEGNRSSLSEDGEASTSLALPHSTTFYSLDTSPRYCLATPPFCLVTTSNAVLLSFPLEMIIFNFKFEVYVYYIYILYIPRIYNYQTINYSSGTEKGVRSLFREYRGSKEAQ